MRILELHRHLDVSVRHSTLHELACNRGLIGQSTSLQTFKDQVCLTRPHTNLAEVLSKFKIYQELLDRPEVLSRVAFEAVEDCLREGLTGAEFRFAPQFVCEFSKMSWDDALSGFEAGLERARAVYPSFEAGLICIAVRDAGVDSVFRTVEHFLKHFDRYIGIDLAGNELGFPSSNFEDAFRPARARGANITVHAGEGAGPEYVWQALEYLGAKRIGHGIRSIEDPKLIERLKRERICLEVCPTSNWITQCVKDLSHHPLPKLLALGVPVTLNTDDPSIFDLTFESERQVCLQKLQMTEEDLEKCFRFADQASFLP